MPFDFGMPYNRSRVIFRRLAQWSEIVLAAVCLAFPLAVRGDDVGKLTELWSVSDGDRVDSTPAVDAQGNIYVTFSWSQNYLDTSGGKLLCVDSNGLVRWRFIVPCDIKSSPAIADDGTVYFGARDRKLHAIDSHGKERWSFSAEFWVDSSPAIGRDGTVYFGSWDQKFYALKPDGTPRWIFSTAGPIDASAAIAKDGTIFFGSHDKNFYALNPDGTRKWTFATQGPIISSPAIDCDGTIYFTSVDGFFYALKPDGTKKWAVWTGGASPSSPVLDPEGNLYMGVTNTFAAFTHEGRMTWWFGYPPVRGSAMITSDGMVYALGNNNGVGVLYGFDHAGVLKTYTALTGESSSSPTIGPDNTIYVGGGKLQAFKGFSGLAKSCWPKYHQNSRQTGRQEQ